MDVEEALEFADQLIYGQTEKHLNDLERQVFVGSWQGEIYEKIYPLNPEYVEKDVGYKLWKKLSTALGEKVTKKNFRGAIERATKIKSSHLEAGSLSLLDDGITRVFISCCTQEPDSRLAIQFSEAIQAAGHQAFVATVGTLPATYSQLGENWPQDIDAQLRQCDYFLLLLSPSAGVSEMVLEELRQAKELRDSRSNTKPVVLPIRVNYPLNAPLNHDLQGYLQGIGQREWSSSADTPTLVQEILTLLANQGEWVLESQEEGETGSTGWGSESRTQSKIQNPESKIPSPVPVADPELPSGQVRLASAFYVERVPYEFLCYKEILQPGALIRIKAPRQMGKTSLMARILYHAKEQGFRTVPLSFQHADTAVFANLNQLLRWFCSRISRKLRLPHQIDDYWSDTYGSKDNCTVYFEDCLLSDTDSPLVLGLDEVDRVFQYPKIADDFFGLLRAWYEEAGYGDCDSDLWQKLRLIVVHSTEVYIPLNVNQSPFNVGLPIELPEFSQEQVQDLTQRHGLNWGTREVTQLMTLVGGHPYLVRLALYHIAAEQITLDQLLETAPTEAGLYDDHLRRHLWNLQQHPELAAAFTKAVTSSTPVELDSVQAFKLHSMGLVQLQGNDVTPRFDLYRQYFYDRLSKF